MSGGGVVSDRLRMLKTAQATLSEDPFGDDEPARREDEPEASGPPRRQRRSRSGPDELVKALVDAISRERSGENENARKRLTARIGSTHMKALTQYAEATGLTQRKTVEKAIDAFIRSPEFRKAFEE